MYKFSISRDGGHFHDDSDNSDDDGNLNDDHDNDDNDGNGDDSSDKAMVLTL